MNSISAKDLEDLKKQWKSLDNVELLQDHGYLIHLMLKNTQQDNKKLNDLLRHNYNEFGIHEIQEQRTQGCYNVAMRNFLELTKSIEELATKENGKPLNNEMKQVLELVKNAKAKCTKDIHSCIDKYHKCLSDNAQLLRIDKETNEDTKMSMS